MHDRVTYVWQYGFYCRALLEFLGCHVVPLRWFLGKPLYLATCIDAWCYGRIYPVVKTKQEQEHHFVTLYFLSCWFCQCTTCWHLPCWGRSEMWSWALVKHKVAHAEVIL